MGDSGDFIFTKRPDGSLEFKGDFEGLYQRRLDPWGQAGGTRMAEYYHFSRSNLVDVLGELGLDSGGKVLEVGCGTGYVLFHLSLFLGPCQLTGVDVSTTAIKRAHVLFPTLEFHSGDFGSPDARYVFDGDRRFDVVVLSQMLWYVLDRMPAVFENTIALLAPRGHLVVQLAFLDNQEYGREIVDGFHGLLKYVLDHHSADFQVVSASYDNSDRYAPHHDGLLVLQAKR